MRFAACKERKFVNRGFLNGPICPIYGIGVGIVVQIFDTIQGKSGAAVYCICSDGDCFGMGDRIILDKLFHNKWWDYSKMPLNLNGYVCPFVFFEFGEQRAF